MMDPITVISMHGAQTQKDHTTVNVKLGTLEMEQCAEVKHKLIVISI